MQFLTLEQTADYLKSATIQTTVDNQFSITHTGLNIAGEKFVLVNDALGNTVLIESL